MPKSKQINNYYFRYEFPLLASQFLVHSGKVLFKLAHNRESTASEVQTFINRLNPKRANSGAGIIGERVEHLPHLQDMILAEFF